MRKNIYTLFLVAALSFGMSSKAYGAIEGYIIKDRNVVYEFNRNKLIESFLDFTEGQGAVLYKTFKDTVKGKGIHMFYDSEGKYVSFKDIEEAFILKTSSNKEFNLDSEVERANKAEVPALIESIKVENKTIVKELIIAKEGTKFDGTEFLKDKYKKIYIRANNISISNVDIEGDIVIDPGVSGKVQLSDIKCKQIEILSGDKKGIHFYNVESHDVKIDKNISLEVQYEDKVIDGGNTPSTGDKNSSSTGDGNSSEVDEATKMKMLEKAQSQLNQAIKVITNENEKAVVIKLKEGIEKAIDDTNYNCLKDIKEVKGMYDNLTEKQKKDLNTKLLQHVDLFNVYDLMRIYGLEEYI